MLYLAAGLNAGPAIAGLALEGARWYYPLFHMLAAVAIGLTIALLCCAAFGWLVRFVPAARLRSASQAAELAPWVALLMAVRLRTLIPRLVDWSWLPTAPGARTALAVSLSIAVGLIVAFGIRALSADYLIRVSEIVHGSSRRRRLEFCKPRISDMVARACGGPEGRAGFEYLSRMMMRDWHFRRQMIMLAPFAIMPAVALVTGSLSLNPFSRTLTAVHTLPHVAGGGVVSGLHRAPIGN